MSEIYIFKFALNDDGEFIEEANITKNFGHRGTPAREEYEFFFPQHQGKRRDYYEVGGEGILSYAAWFDGELV